jgi:uncharacterized protein YcfJ
MLLVTGCVSAPAGPTVMALPGAGKTFDQFQVDNAACRDWAREQASVGSDGPARSTVTGAAVGTVLGGVLGAALGALTHRPAAGAAIGAGVGLAGGTAAGASHGGEVALSAQRRYDAAYTQCMYAKGERVPLPAGAVRSSVAPTPPPPPPPPPPS